MFRDPIEWRFRSADGFLGENESFENVILQDREKLEHIKETKESLANLIRNAMNESDKIIKERFNIPFIVNFNGHQLEVTKNWFMSPQYSLFYNENIENSIYNEAWQCEYIFKNIKNQLPLKIGGSQNCGIIHYIERIGFFEGGHPKNDYRVDPYLIIGVLTGKIYEETIKIIQDKFKYKISIQEEEVKYLNDLKGKSKDKKEEEEYLNNIIEKKKNEIKEKQTELELLINTLK